MTSWAGTAARTGAWLGLALMAAAAVRRWSIQLSILVAGGPGWAALDLLSRGQETAAWFAGVSVYETFDSAVYPPASYLLFRPWFGLSSAEPNRWVWAALLVASTAALSVLALRVVRPRRPEARVFLTLLPWAHYASAAGVGVGQIALPALLSLAAGLALRFGPTRPVSAASDFGAGGLFALALVKPHLTALFGWLLVLPRGRLRSFGVAAALYAALTVAAASLQPHGPIELVAAWLGNAAGVPADAGYGYLLRPGGAAGFGLAAGLAGVLVAAGAVGLGRRLRRSPLSVDPWLLAGLTAIVTRAAFYHRLPSDLLVLFPVVGLLRVGGAAVDARARAAAWTIAGLVAAGGLLPTSWHLGGPPRSALFDGVQIALWIVLGGLCIAWAVRPPRRDAALEPS